MDKKEKKNKLINLFYELVESKEPKTIISIGEICEYVKGKFGVHGFTNYQIFKLISTRQLKYHVFQRRVKTLNDNYRLYIFVRRDNEEIREQIKNMKAHRG